MLRPLPVPLIHSSVAPSASDRPRMSSCSGFLASAVRSARFARPHRLGRDPGIQQAVSELRAGGAPQTRRPAMADPLCMRRRRAQPWLKRRRRLVALTVDELNGVACHQNLVLESCLFASRCSHDIPEVDPNIH
jgi:hypothetical protein